jgi:hypothetical protein
MDAFTFIKPATLTAIVIRDDILIDQLLRFRRLRSKRFGPSITKQKISPCDMTTQDSSANESYNRNSNNFVRAPIKYIGLYPCLGLRFPVLTTANQRRLQNNITGVSLDFMIDTAANLNVIQSVIATELNLTTVTSQLLPGFTSSGRISNTASSDASSNTFMLGDAQLEYCMDDNKNVIAVPLSSSQNNDNNIFMTKLTASVVPNIACPTAGILSLAFLQVFAGGVEFTWGTSSANNLPQLQSQPKKANMSTPYITFYGDKSIDHMLLRDRLKVRLLRIPLTQLLSVQITINDCLNVLALLDTGSPITVIHPQIAKLANVTTMLPFTKTNDRSTNPFSSISNRMLEAQATSRGELLTILGSNGQNVNLIRSKEPIHITIPTLCDVSSKIDVDFGSIPLFVGEFPGLTMMMQQQEIDNAAVILQNSVVGVVLGMDILRQRPSTLLRAQDNEVWF